MEGSFKLSDNNNMVENILQKRYYQPGETKWSDLVDRVVEYVIPDYKEKEQVRDELNKKLWLPNSPCLMSAGTDNNQLAACFVIGMKDSMESIFDCIKRSALIQKSGGGVGYSFSNLRPEGSSVQSTDGVASGPVSFIEPFNAMTDVIKQGGKRRGANMGVLRVDHPDIEKFIKVKDDHTKLNNFNLSVMVTDEFMQAVIDDKCYNTKYNGNNYHEFNANYIMNLIAERAWSSGEPGILFYDTINNTPLRDLGSIDSTNPCGLR